MNNDYLGLENRELWIINNELWTINNQQELIGIVEKLMMNSWKKHPKNGG